MFILLIIIFLILYLSDLGLVSYILEAWFELIWTQDRITFSVIGFVLLKYSIDYKFVKIRVWVILNLILEGSNICYNINA